MKALLMGYYGVRNLGDEFMLYCLSRWLAKQNIEIAALTEGPFTPPELHAIRNLPLMCQWSWRYVWLRGHGWKLLNELWRYDAIIAGGGDIIRDDRGWKQFSYSIEKFLFCILTHKPFYLVNVGIGEPSTSYGRKLLPWVLRRAAGIIVRDHRSLELCRRMGVGSITRNAPDIVSQLDLFMPVTNERLEEPYAVVCLRGNPNVNGQFEWTNKRADALAAALDRLIADRGLRVVFVPFQTTEDEDDNRIHRRVRSAMKHADITEVREWSGRLHEVAGIIGGASLVIAMRLHAAVVAAAFRRRMVILAYDHKVTAFASQEGVETMLTAEDLDSASSVTSTLSSALEGPAPHKPPAVDWGSLGFFN